MNWKIISLASLIVLALTMLAYGIRLYSPPYDLYMSVGKFKRVPSWLISTAVPIGNVSYWEREQIIKYFKAGDILDEYVEVSNEWCRIREWTKSMYETHSSQSFVVEHEDEYYQVILVSKKAYKPLSLEDNVNMTLFFLTVSLWIVFIYGAIRELD